MELPTQSALVIEHPRLACILCLREYVATIVHPHTGTFAADGPLLCAGCSEVAEQLLNVQIRELMPLWTQEENSMGSRRTKFLKRLATMVGEGDIARFGESRARLFQNRIPAPKWWWSRTLLQRIVRQFQTDRRGTRQGYRVERSLLFANLHWGCGHSVTWIAERFNLTPDAVADVLRRFRVRADRFLLGLLTKRLPVRFSGEKGGVLQAFKKVELCVSNELTTDSDGSGAV